jgi:tetratricopeptide (TPR) repeat protein
MTAPPQPAKPPAAADDIPAAAPQEEMGLSNSTLHWLEDGEQAVPGRLTEPGSMASYDPRAPVPGRKRAVLVVGLAGAVALIVAGTMYVSAQKRRAAEPAAPATIEPARDLTNRAEAALAANKIDEALELAHLALVADPRFADAHFAVGICKQARHENNEARAEFRKYLELAPLGTHAADARTALSTLPP